MRGTSDRPSTPSSRRGSSPSRTGGRRCRRRYRRASVLAQRLDHQQSDHAATDHDDVVPGRRRSEADGMDCDGHGLDERRMLERQRVGQPVDDPRRHRHVFGERAVAAIVGARHAEHRPTIAEVDLAAPAEVAPAARHGGIERDAIARRQIADALNRSARPRPPPRGPSRAAGCGGRSNRRSRAHRCRTRRRRARAPARRPLRSTASRRRRGRLPGSVSSSALRSPCPSPSDGRASRSSRPSYRAYVRRRRTRSCSSPGLSRSCRDACPGAR